jgi:uncharacterized membrane protein YdbT with pleckstrin-like domain
MGIAMSDGEEVVLDLHPHWGQLFLPVLVFLVIAGGGGFGAAVVPSGTYQGDGRLAIVVVGVLILVWFTALPYLRWLTTRYVLTDQRLVIRTGVVARHGRDVPLDRINDVSFSETLFERMLRSGTLVVESAGERGQIALKDVPRVEHVQRELYRMVEEQHGDARGRHGGDEGDPPEQFAPQRSR